MAAASNKRAWKLHEFVAHTGNVNCLALGHKSGRVMVTGGDDKKINLWAIGKPNCIMSLSGHSTAVECVRFGHTEELVCAGSLSGALKIWDLEAAKLVRTLTGHKSNVKSVDFHPYGDFLASGSGDTNIKLWDIRRKGCIFTYKGHQGMVNSIKFSPDGQWIASAGNDGIVKIWDLRAGKLLTELKGHTGPVADVEFHPAEFLLCSGSADKRVHFWDLENFSLVSSSDGECGAIRCVRFNAEGACVFAGSQDMLKVYGWEPSKSYDTLMMGWGKVQDIATSAQQLVGASFHTTNVSIFIVDMKKVRPFGSIKHHIPVLESNDTPVNSFQYGHTVRKSFIKDKSKSPPMKMQEESDPSSTTENDDDTQSIADVYDVGNHKEIFAKRDKLNRTPPPPESSESDEPMLPDVVKPSSKVQKSSYRNIRGSRGSVDSRSTDSETKLSDGLKSSVRSNRSRSNEGRRDSVKDLLQPNLSQTPGAKERNAMKHSPSEPAFARYNGNKPDKDVPALGQTYTKPDSSYFYGSQSPVPLDKPTIHRTKPTPPVTKIEERRPVEAVKPFDVRSDSCDKETDIVPAQSDVPSGLDFDEFLPKKLVGGLRLSTSPMVESDVLATVNKGHASMVTVLTNRQRSLQIAHSLWFNKDVKTAIDSALVMNDEAIIVDLLSVLNLRPSIWNLDLVSCLLPTISNLLQSKYEIYMTAGCSALRLILKTFGTVIKTNIQAPVQSVGVDISREERYNKCMTCYTKLVSIRAFILKRQTLQGKLGHEFRELSILMQTLDQC